MPDNQTDLSGWLGQLLGQPQVDQTDSAISGFTPQNTTGADADEETAKPAANIPKPPKTFGQRLHEFGNNFAQGFMAAQNPTFFQNQQENQRQQQEMERRKFEFGHLSQYQEQTLAMRQGENEQGIADEKANRTLGNIKWLAQQHGEGNIVEASPDDKDAIQIEGHYVKPAPQMSINVPAGLQDIFGTSSIAVNKNTQSVIDRLFGAYETGLNKKKAQDPKFLQDSLDQIDRIYPTTPQADASKAQPGVQIPEFSPANPSVAQLAYKHNNPGNLKYAGQDGATQGENGFAKFKSPEEGYAALHHQIAMDSQRGLNLAQYIAKYAPLAENATGQYIFQAMNALGVPGRTPLSQIDPEKLAQFQIQKESGSSITAPSAEDAGSAPTDNAKFAANYKAQVRNMFESGDTAGINKLITSITDSEAKAKRDASAAGEKVKADDKAGMADARIQFPDEKLESMYKNIKLGAVNPQDAEKMFGISDKYARRRWAEFLLAKKDPLPVALDGPTRQHLAAIEPVLDSLKKLKLGLQPYAKDTTPGTFAGKRLMYQLGIGDPDGSGGLISTGEMDRIRGAAQSLTGLRTTLATLEQAQIHTPNFWTNSGKLMNDKVDNMINYLENQEQKLYKFGAKSGIVQQDTGGGNKSKLGPPPAGKQWVRRKSDGQVGPQSIGAFDPNKYEKVTE